MKKILLISPDFNPELPNLMKSSGTKESRVVRSFLARKGWMAPLGLTTIAALTPDDVDVDIWDEAIRGPIDENTEFKKDYDLAGVTGYTNHFARVTEISSIMRQRGIPVAIGGPGVSAEPEHYREHFDIRFIGEAEYTWPRFIADWKSGRHRPEYRQVAKVDMEHSPLPVWDKVAASLKSYMFGGVQTTRGCPFDCEFCDVISLYGRQARHKPIDAVLEEIRTLERLGIGSIFFCDDNFIGAPRYAKALLKKLIPLNRSFRRPVGFSTQLSLNLAKDDELMELLADANFSGVFIGVETPNLESLVETNKRQNYETDMVAAVRRIHGYSITIFAGMIVGFDHDDPAIFDRQFEFLQRAGIAIPTMNMLKAPTGTRLWVRLHKEGRLVDIASMKQAVDVFPVTNIVPKRMTRVQLMSGYRGLVQRIRDWRNFEARVKVMISQMLRRPKVKPSRSWKRILTFFGFVLFTMDREARRTTIRLFLHTLLRTPLRRVPFIMEKVGGLILWQYIHAAQMPYVEEMIGEQIRLESTQGIEREQATFFVPDAFKEPYKALFPDLYQRVHQGLSDKSRTDNALVEVIYDFLTRWGPTFNRFEEHHRTNLFELCDRTIAKENSEQQQGAGEAVALRQVPEDTAGLVEGRAAIWLSRLADEVLRSVDRSLRGFRLQQEGA